ncbi:hypothetical protein L6R50_28130 [Myxococcota bacterium]|nr:hypothetical protein [Myxococcota bacterium]
MLDQAASAQIVAEGTVSTLWYEDVDPDRGLVRTRVVVDVDTLYKGDVTSGTFLLTLPGGVGASGHSLVFPDVPEVRVGERVILHAFVQDEESVGLQNFRTGLLRFEVDDLGAPLVLDGQGGAVHDFDAVGGVVMEDAGEGGVPAPGDYAEDPADEVMVEEPLDPAADEPGARVGWDDVRSAVADAVTLTAGEGREGLTIAGFEG